MIYLLAPFYRVAREQQTVASAVVPPRPETPPPPPVAVTTDGGSRRQAYAEVILRHWPTPTSGCSCGQVELGHSWPLHLADELLGEKTAPE